MTNVLVTSKQSNVRFPLHLLTYSDISNKDSTKLQLCHFTIIMECFRKYLTLLHQKFTGVNRNLMKSSQGFVLLDS